MNPLGSGDGCGCANTGWAVFAAGFGVAGWDGLRFFVGWAGGFFAMDVLVVLRPLYNEAISEPISDSGASRPRLVVMDS
jgi:hypothetical protein